MAGAAYGCAGDGPGWVHHHLRPRRQACGPPGTHHRLTGTVNPHLRPLPRPGEPAPFRYQPALTGRSPSPSCSCSTAASADERRLPGVSRSSRQRLPHHLADAHEHGSTGGGCGRSTPAARVCCRQPVCLAAISDGLGRVSRVDGLRRGRGAPFQVFNWVPGRRWRMATAPPCRPTAVPQPGGAHWSLAIEEQFY